MKTITIDWEGVEHIHGTTVKIHITTETEYEAAWSLRKLLEAEPFKRTVEIDTGAVEAPPIMAAAPINKDDDIPF